MSILTADFAANPEEYMVDVVHTAALPTQTAPYEVTGPNRVDMLADRLRESDGFTTVYHYKTSPTEVSDLTIDQSFREVDECNDWGTHWMTWLQAEGYGTFIRDLVTAAETHDQLYLVASTAELSDDEAKSIGEQYIQELLERNDPLHFSRGY